jgi:hypothetical protein
MSEKTPPGPSGPGVPAPAPNTPGITSPYPVATPHQLAAAVPHKTAKRTPWLLLSAIAVAALIIGGVLAVLLAPKLIPPCGLRCPPPGPPPRPGSQMPGDMVQSAPAGLVRSPSPASGPLVPAGHMYTSSKYGYSLEYDPRFPPTKKYDTGALWSCTLCSTGAPYEWAVIAGPASGRSAQQIVRDLELQERRMGRDTGWVYDVQGAEVGYTLGYGSIYDQTFAPATGPTVPMRLVIVVAVKNGLAISGVALAPFVADADHVWGHPNPAQTWVVIHLDPVINSVVWPGDRPL